MIRDLQIVISWPASSPLPTRVKVVGTFAKISAEDLATMLQLYREGVTVEKIAFAVQRSRRTVEKALTKHFPDEPRRTKKR